MRFEPLEHRRMLATFLVNTTSDILADDSVAFGSLRWAIGQANATDAEDTIVFADGLFINGPATIVLGGGPNGGQLTITQPLRILGPGPGDLTIQQTRGSNRRIFELNIRDEDQIFPVEISGVTLSRGNLVGTGDDARGGAIFNRENLTMVETIVSFNSAGGGGGGIYTHRGRLSIDRSLLQFNSAGVGGAIMNGTEDDENTPTTNITNSTFYDNSASGVPEEYPAWGGAIFNRNGTLNLISSTLTGNVASAGGGVASFGNPVPDEPGGTPPAPTVFTFIGHSIIWGNNATDVDRVGQTEESPPQELLPSVFGPLMPGMPPMPGTLGYNMVGTGNTTTPTIMVGMPPMAMPNPDFAFFSMGDQVGVDPLLIGDPLGRPLDAGGSTPVFLLDPASTGIDAGDPLYVGSAFEQRGRHFTRVAPEPNTPGAMPVVDVGAAEMQEGLFVVDSLLDVSDRRFSFVYSLEFFAGLPVFTIPLPPFSPYEVEGNFAIREAIEFASKNPGLDTILFSPNLNSIDLLDKEDLNDSPAPTIILVLGPLSVNEDLIIQGPSSYILEIDAVGNDTNPVLQNGTGSRVLVVDDLDPTTQSNIVISDLTLMGADFVGRGGGIFSRENLSLSHLTLKNNYVTDDGAGVFLTGATLTIDGSTFNNNRAGDDGAGLFVAGGATASIVNSTFSGNAAGDRGAGIVNENSQLTVEYSTITLNNSGSTFGSGINNFGAMAVTEVGSSIVSGNNTNDINFLASTGATIAGFTSLGWNFIGRGNAIGAFTMNDVTFATHGAFATDPKLEPLLNTGGLVETHRPTYKTAEGTISPVIDAGNPAPVNAPMYDQRGPGFVRIFPPAAFGRIDIGSYELQASTFIVSTPIDENDGDLSPGNFSLREAIALANDNPLRDTIRFDTLSIGDTIFLGSGALRAGTPSDLRITTPMTIELLPGEALAIDAAFLDNPSLTIQGSRMFTINDGNAANHIDVTITGLEFRNAIAPEAGGVFWSSENLMLQGVTLINNQTFDFDETSVGLPAMDLVGLHGGAIYQQGAAGLLPRPTLTITHNPTTFDSTLITGNSTDDVDADGGAVYAVNANLVINNSTTIAGNSTKGANSEGGGVAVRNSLFTLEGSTLSGNSASAAASDGGGFFSDNSTVTVSEAVISGNSTHGSFSEGGGFAGLNSTITLNDVVVSLNNTFGSQSSGAGAFTRLDTGVLATAQSALTLNRSLVTQNIASGQLAMGGGVAVNGGSALLDSTTVSLNQVTGATSHGGGVANLGGVVTMRGTTISNNKANHSQSKGGGVYSDTSLGGQSTLILNSTISGNTAKLRGGGVFNADGLTEIKHSTITNNDVPLVVTSIAADFDSDIDVDGTDFLVWQRNLGRINAAKSQGDANGDTVVNGADLAIWKTSVGAPSSLPNAGSGVASQGSASTLTRVQSSIIAGNRGPGAAGADVDSVDPSSTNSFQSLGYNLIGVGGGTIAFNQAGDMINVVNPGLNPLGLYGQPSAMTFDLPTHTLQSGSPAVNRGNPAFNPNSFSPPLTTDQIGAVRVQMGRIDIGAVESAFATAMAASESFATSSTVAALLAEEPAMAPTPGGSASRAHWSLASLGAPGAPTADEDQNEPAVEADESLVWEAALATLDAQFPCGASSRKDLDELEWLVNAAEESEDASAEDEVFAAWGELI